MGESIQVEISDGLARLLLTQPERGNPIDGALCAQLSEIAIDLSERPEVRCVLLTAQGKSFSFGGDIKGFTGDLANAPRNVKRWTTTLNSAIARFQYMDAPLVAAVQGTCAGGMSGFVAGCDFVIASADARFLAAYAGIGFSCDAGASITYVRRMGIARARRFLLMNETLVAPDALAAGLVDEVVAPGDLSAHALSVAQHLASGPTKAFGETRRLLASACCQPLETQLELEAQALARIVATADAREGVTAFVARRKPVFVGR